MFGLSCSYLNHVDTVIAQDGLDAGQDLLVKWTLTMDDVSPHGRTALVVTSDGGKQRFFEAILSEAGFLTNYANTGSGAVNLLATQPFELLLINVSTCDPSTLRICQTARELYGYHILIIAVIGVNDRHLHTLSLQLGADDCIQDPFHVEELLARIYARMRRKAGNNR